MTKTFANGRSIVHKGDGKTNISAAPDVCKTPSPGGPVPVPYVNMARDSDLSEASKTVELEGNPVALKSSALSTSTGDEAGTAGGGLISSKTKGKMTWGTYSLDVKFEGKGVVRFMDVTQHNGNTFNTAFLQDGGTGLSYGDDPVKGNTKCSQCKKDKSEHRIHERHPVQAEARKLSKEILRVASKQKLEMLKTHENEEGVELLSGYMIGVLICKCGQKLFAAMSGGYYVGAFTEAVKSLQQRDGRWTLCSPLGKDAIVTNPQGKKMKLSEFKDNLGRNRPGVCAGPQLIQKALGDGHVPGSMSEIWFRPPILRRFPQGSKLVRVKHLRNELEVEKAFRHRQSVPSCDTCKVVLTAMLCDVQEKTC
ncbi:DUF4150 domain-containing protein [Archangium violaceum]|uniref:DUF4150 domain-containing protein n=1 Tax=Archangium violaceum TaxID=83451 RepID=UPI00094951E8|nr:DUF4150 domain-containing protein [Archangium violaceum]